LKQTYSCNGSNDYESYLGQTSQDKFLQVWIISTYLKLKQDGIQEYFFFCSIHLTTTFFCCTFEIFLLGCRSTRFCIRGCSFPSKYEWLVITNFDYFLNCHHGFHFYSTRLECYKRICVCQGLSYDWIGHKFQFHFFKHQANLSSQKFP